MGTNPRPKIRYSYPIEHRSIKLVYKGADCVLKDFTSFNRTPQQSAKIEYSYFGTPIIKRESFKAKYKWDFECLINRTEYERLNGIIINQDYDIQHAPLTDYFITCYDYTATIGEHINELVKRPEAPTTPPNWGQYSPDSIVNYYFAEFKVLIPAGEVSIEWGRNLIKTKVVMYEK